jgi:hypothetical protein
MVGTPINMLKEWKESDARKKLETESMNEKTRS